MNNSKRLRKMQRGQGLVEYALILVLVALVVIVAAFLVGQATQRIFGIVLGATGGTTGTSGDLYIAGAYCYMSASRSITSIYVMVHSAGGTADLYASDDLQATNMTDVNGGPWPWRSYGGDASGTLLPTPGTSPNFAFDSANAFVLDSTLAYDVEPQLCPTAITVQNSHGGIAAAPVIAVVDS